MDQHRYLMGYLTTTGPGTTITGRMKITLNEPFSPENLDDVEADMLRVAQQSWPKARRVVITSVWKFED